MVWYKRTDKKFKDSEKKSIPDGLWEKCDSCNEILFRPELEKNLSVCHHCQHHFRVSPEIYLDLLIDKGSETQLFSTLESKDFLGFKAGEKYSTQISGARRKTGDLDAIKIYSGTLRKRPIILGSWRVCFKGDCNCWQKEDSFGINMFFRWCSNAGRCIITDAISKN